MTAAQSSSKNQSSGSFHLFPKLPVEVQLEIWNRALPDPRNVPDVIMLFVNLDLTHPKALIPTKESLRTSYKALKNGDWTEYDEAEYESWKSQEASSMSITESQSVVYDLMHACRQPRKVARKTFRSDHESMISEGDNPFWTDQGDTIYFRAPDNIFELLWIHQYWKLPRGPSLLSFEGLCHIAFDIRIFTTMDLAYLSYSDSEDEHLYQSSLLNNFPSLRTLTLLVDLSDLHGNWRTGRIALYEPEPSTCMDHFTRTAEQVENVFERILKQDIGKKEVPMIEVLVMLRRPHKKSRR